MTDDIFGKRSLGARLRRLREFFLLDEELRRGARAGGSRARSIELTDAAGRRIDGARVLRDAGLSTSAIILFRQGGLLLARAYLDAVGATGAAAAAAAADARATVEQLTAALAADRQTLPARVAAGLSHLADADDTAVDRLPAREAAAQSAELDDATRWLADRLAPRTPRQLRRTRNLRLSLALLSILAIPVARAIWLVSPTNVALDKKVTSSSQTPTSDLHLVVDNYPYGPALFETKTEASPWVAVDLGAPYLISDAEVFARHDCCFDQAIPLAFEISNDGVAYRQVATKTDPFVSLLPWIVKPLQVKARYVRVRVLRQSVLALSEIVVFGHRQQ